MAGCGTQYEASVDVIVPVAVQEQYNRETPGELILVVETDGDFSQQLILGVLCDASDEPRAAVWTLTGSGCAAQADLTAWVQNADPNSTCDGGPANTLTVGAEPDDDAWVGSAVLFEGNTRGCLHGDETLILTLEPPA